MPDKDIQPIELLTWCEEQLASVYRASGGSMYSYGYGSALRDLKDTFLKETFSEKYPPKKE